MILIPHSLDRFAADGPRDGWLPHAPTPAGDDLVASARATADRYLGILAGDDGVPSAEIHDVVRDVARFLDGHDQPIEAGALLSALARPLRAANDARLPGTLHDLAIALVHQDELDRAADAITEAVAGYRALVTDRGADDADLAEALYLLALVNAGRDGGLDEGLAAGEEAAERFRNRARREPRPDASVAAAEVAALDVVHLLLLLLGRDGDAAALARRRAELE